MSDKVQNKTNALLIGRQAQNETASYVELDLMAQCGVGKEGEAEKVEFTTKKGEPCK